MLEGNCMLLPCFQQIVLSQRQLHPANIMQITPFRMQLYASEFSKSCSLDGNCIQQLSCKSRPFEGNCMLLSSANRALSKAIIMQITPFRRQLYADSVLGKTCSRGCYIHQSIIMQFTPFRRRLDPAVIMLSQRRLQQKLSATHALGEGQG